MGSWCYHHDSGQKAGCPDKPKMTLYIASCDGRSAAVTVREETGKPGETIATIHVDREAIPEVARVLAMYGGVSLEELIAYLQEELDDLNAPVELGS